MRRQEIIEMDQKDLDEAINDWLLKRSPKMSTNSDWEIQIQYHESESRKVTFMAVAKRTA